MTTYVQPTPKMTRSEEELKALVKRATKAQADHSTLRIPKAMQVTTFMLDESTDHTLQMRVCRASMPPPQAIDVMESLPS